MKTITLISETEEDLNSAMSDLIAQGWETEGGMNETDEGYTQTMKK